MSSTVKLTRMEGHLFLREPMSLFFGLVFPPLLLLGLGYLFPGFDEPSPDFDSRRLIDVYAPVAIAFGLAMLGLSSLPPLLGTYRQFGILRRLRTTPLHPARLLWALMIVHGAVAVLATLAVLLVAVAAFDVPLPQRPVWFTVSFLLAAAAMFTTGLLVGARVRTTQAGVATGMAIWFPMLFFAGLWIPRPLMPDTLSTLSEFTPLGAAVEAMTDSWFGATPSAVHIAVAVGYSVVVGLVAVRTFRWD